MKKLFALMAVAACAAAAPAAAQSVEEFYKSHPLNLVVGYPPGGGYDIYARVLSNHYGRHIPGSPSVIVRNRPGAASLVSVNELYAANPKDGSYIATFARSVAMDRLLGRQSTNFVPTEINWIGSANNEISICAVWHTVGIKSAQDLLTREVVFGANAAGSESDAYPNILRNLLGAKVRIVTGYPGGQDIMLAMERGEVQGRCGFTWSALQATNADWLRDGKIDVVLQFATEKHPDMPSVPTVMEMARTPVERQALELILAGQAMGRPFAAPPGVPKERVEALRRGFDETMKDPAFIADAVKAKIELQPVTGEKIQALIEQMFAAPKDVIEMARKAVERPE